MSETSILFSNTRSSHVDSISFPTHCCLGLLIKLLAFVDCGYSELSWQFGVKLCILSVKESSRRKSVSFSSKKKNVLHLMGAKMQDPKRHTKDLTSCAFLKFKRFLLPKTKRSLGGSFVFKTLSLPATKFSPLSKFLQRGNHVWVPFSYPKSKTVSLAL